MPDYEEADVIAKAEDGTPTAISYTAFQRLAGARDELATKFGDAETRLGGLTAAEQAKAEAERQLGIEKTTRLEERGFFGAGLDPEGFDIARFLYEKTPEAERPKEGIVAWVNAAKADPTKAPKALAAYFQAAQPVTPPPVAPVVAPPVDPNSGVVIPSAGPPATEVLSDAAIAEITRKACETGDFSEYDKHRDAILARTSSRR